MRGQPGFLDVKDRLQRLSDLGDQLDAFAKVVDFEMFRSELEAALGYSDRASDGRPPFDPVMMFKILVIQAQKTLSDDRAEFLINDRLSFMRVLGLGLADKAPDAKTIWFFRERLTKAGAIEGLFARFGAAVREAGYIPCPVRSSTPASSPRRSSATATARMPTSRPAAFPRRGWPSRKATPEGPRRPLDTGLRQGPRA